MLASGFEFMGNVFKLFCLLPVTLKRALIAGTTIPLLIGFALSYPPHNIDAAPLLFVIFYWILVLIICWIFEQKIVKGK